jgi:hypothetical protein
MLLLRISIGEAYQPPQGPPRQPLGAVDRWRHAGTGVTYAAQFFDRRLLVLKLSSKRHPAVKKPRQTFNESLAGHRIDGAIDMSSTQMRRITCVPN